MGKVLTTLRRGNTRTAALVAIIAAAIVVPASLYAWGPSRATFTEASPAPYVTFNSITDNQVYGDERDFVSVKDASNKQDGGWANTVNVEPGKEYVVRMYVHNNAASNLNLVAENVRASASIKQGTAKNIAISGFVSADNANPKQVWDDVSVTSSQDFNVNYVPGSATFHNNSVGAAPEGAALSDNIMTSGGALLGYDKLDGKIPGCYKYSGYVYFRVKPQFAPTNKFETTKQVRKVGDATWTKSVNVNPGDQVEYLLGYKNTGETQQNNVIMRDELPQGVSYVAGSTYLKNAANPSYTKVSDNLTTATGININGYTPGSNAYVKFTAKVSDNSQLPTCGTNTLTNRVHTTVDNGYLEDTADVTVNKECKPQPEYKCTALAVSTLSDNKFKFETGYSVSGGTFKSVSYTVRNEAGQTVATVAGTPNVAEYTQTTPGKYTVQATVTFTVDGKDVTATGDACKKAFEVPTPEEKTIIVCELDTKKIVTIKESEFDSTKYSKNLDDCKEVPSDIVVCELATKKIVTIKESEFDANKYSKNLDDCKEQQIIVCEIATKTIVTINESAFDSSKYSKDTSVCQTTPVTPVTPVTPTTPTMPTELPQTGSNDGVLTIAGLATLALVLGYAVTARRTLG